MIRFSLPQSRRWHPAARGQVYSVDRGCQSFLGNEERRALVDVHSSPLVATGNAMLRRCPFFIAILLSACSTTPSPMASFSGTWIGNESESVTLPGQHVPTNLVGEIKDDGHMLRTAQIYLNNQGQEIGRLVWDSVCDGRASPVSGTDKPGTVTLSCLRLNREAFSMELRDQSGYSHVETCVLSVDGRKHTCSGTATFPDGSKGNFVYVFDRK
jgi:hypothetical protein